MKKIYEAYMIGRTTIKEANDVVKTRYNQGVLYRSSDGYIEIQGLGELEEKLKDLLKNGSTGEKVAMTTGILSRTFTQLAVEKSAT